MKMKSNRLIFDFIFLKKVYLGMEKSPQVITLNF